MKAKAAYSAPLCRYIAHHKTVAVAEILLASPRTAQEVLIVRTLKWFRLHEAFVALGKEAETQSAYRVLEEQARCFPGKLGLEIEEGEAAGASSCSLSAVFMAQELSCETSLFMRALTPNKSFGEISMTRHRSGMRVEATAFVLLPA